MTELNSIVQILIAINLFVLWRAGTGARRMLELRIAELEIRVRELLEEKRFEGAVERLKRPLHRS